MELQLSENLINEQLKSVRGVSETEELYGNSKSRKGVMMAVSAMYG
jgi:hypothetical protein